MDKKYSVSYEEIQKDKEDFYREGLGKVSSPPHCDLNRIARRWLLLLREQHGENFDDYVMEEGHKIERYLLPWAPPPQKVLFLGTGTGREVYAAKQYGYDAYGTTLGKENLPFAKWKFNLDLALTDNCSIPAEDKTFDTVAGFQIFEHCHAPYLFLVECCRVLKEEGLLILEWPPFMATADGTATPNPGQMHNFMGDYNDDNLHHMCCWTPAQGWILARRCGFKDVEVFISGFGNGHRAAEENLPRNLTRITEEDDAFWSNVSPGDIVLKARRRRDSEMPNYMQALLVS